jgi:hypothetical protein
MIKRRQFLRIGILIVTVATVAFAQSAAAATCNVPSAPHPTIQAAIDDIGCTEIVVAAGTFTEGPVIARSLSVQGAGSGSTFFQGQVEVSAGTVSLTGLNIAAAGEALWAHSGAEVSGFDLEVVNGVFETPLFADGFESGGTGAWSAVVP